MRSFSRDGERSQLKDWPVLAALLFLLCWVPLPLASNRWWAHGLLLGWVMLAWVLVAVCWREHSALLFQRLGQFKLPLMLVWGLCALAYLQSLSLPISFVAMLSPQAAADWRAVMPGTLTASFSIDPGQTRIAATLAFAYASCATFAVLSIRDSTRLKILAYTLLGSGLFQAMVGLILFSTHAHYLFLTTAVNHDYLLGTFVYKNNAAGYFELCLAVGIGLMMGQLESSSNATRKRAVVKALQFVLSKKMQMRLMLVILVIALVLTRSRMGNAGFFAAMIVAGGIWMFAAKRSARTMAILLVSLVVVDVVIIGKWVGLDKVAERLDETRMTLEEANEDRKIKAPSEQSMEERLLPARSTAAALSDYPVTGSGGGTFFTVFPRYSPAGLSGYWDHAHNDYLELLGEYGVVGISMFAVLAISSAGMAIRVMRRRYRSVVRGVGLGVLMAILAYIFHSLVDFNLQIPATAMTATVLVMMAWIADRVGMDESGRRRG
ncbi:O-antigen ligase family protein [Burkholderiaceae bacterium DAT-1]|nr:O-antigen ligase family protein [Burkholderiaceae bacterium DAT-1]